MLTPTDVTGAFGLQQLRLLAARASMIKERMGGRFLVEEDGDSFHAAEDRLAKWCETAAAGDKEIFSRRLAMAGVKQSDMNVLLGDVVLAPGQELPQWIYGFSWMLEALMSPVDSGVESAAGECTDPLPFEDLFYPLVSAAVKRCKLARGSKADLLCPTGYRGLERMLLVRLTSLCSPSLFEGFTLHRLSATPHALFHGWPLTGDTDSHDLYRDYIDALRRGELTSFFSARPVVARLLVTTTQFWISSTTQFLARLEADLPAIRDSFFDGRAPGLVTGIRGIPSDPHNGGQSVLQVTFQSGLTIGYKPKDLGLDLAWGQMIRWLKSHGAPQSALAPKVVQCDGYGWVEWISSKPCPDESAVARFFERAGAMLCLFQFLRGVDFHSENIVASGDHPVPVDLETLLHPAIPNYWRVVDDESAAGRAARWLRDSVLATSYLPKWVATPGGYSAAIGGLNPAELQNARRWGFRATNTDGMSYEPIPVVDSPAFHLPTMPEAFVSPGSFSDRIESGYAAMYRFLLSSRNELLGKNGPLDEFRGKVVRVILRPTVLYSLLLRKAMQRQYLAHGIEWSLQFDFLARFSDFLEPTGNTERIRVAEQRSLEQLDIPFFTSRTDSTALFLPDGEIIKGFFRQSAFDQLIDRSVRMSQTDLNCQLSLIRQAFSGGRGAPTMVRASRTANEGLLLTASQAIQTARTIAARLEKHAIRGSDGVAWIGSVPLAGENGAQLDLAGYDLYSGASGVALFFAALHRVTNDAAARDIAMAALEPLRRDLVNSYRRLRLARVMGIGGASGVGSLVYTLARSAVLLSDDVLLDSSLACADLITNELILADRSYDVIAGAAGALLGLLALYRECPERHLLTRAITCGTHLVASQRDCAKGGRAWRTIGNHELTGFSHGASGIALALLRLYRETDERRFADSARAALWYEDTLFSSDAGNWPDLRTGISSGGVPTFACQWCHGAPGIGLARIGAVEVLEEACDHAYIEAAIRTTVQAPELAVDHLCCGNLGRLEVLQVAGQWAGREDLTQEALRRAEGLVSGAECAGSFRFSSGIDEFNPGFFTGLAGVGYQLLRMTHQELLPSVLLWE